jgi:antitoxin ParD1/3/4
MDLEAVLWDDKGQMRAIHLADETAQMVDEQVRSGRAASADAIVRAGLAAVEREQAKLLAVRAALIEGEESGIAEPGSFDRARAHVRALVAGRYRR